MDLTDLRDVRIIEVTMRTRKKLGEETEYSSSDKIDRLSLYEGMGDYAVFGGERWKHLELNGFKVKLRGERKL